MWSPTGLMRRRSTKRQEANGEPDEWYVPYKAPTSPNGAGGIGDYPSPTRAATVGRNRGPHGAGGNPHNSGLFSLFSTTSSGSSSSSWDLHTPAGPNSSRGGVLQQQQERHHIANEEYNARPRLAGRLGSRRGKDMIQPSPSQPSLSDRGPLPQLPSSSSVPTGLEGDKMLFSPLNRQVRQSQHRSNLSIESTPEKTDAPTAFTHQRRRVHSAPRYLNRHAAQSMCELLVFPKPSLTPHLITPPSSPDDSPAGVVELGRQRDKERNEMAVRSRSRSLSRDARQRRLSFGEEKSAKGAPIVGSLVARRDEAVKRERRRSRSLERRERFHSLSRGFGTGGRYARPTEPLPHRSNSCSQARDGSAIDSGRESDLSVAIDQTSSRGSRTHHHTRSDPDLLNNPRIRSQPLRVRMRAPDDVVVIGPDSPPRIDFSKPLPALPYDAEPEDLFPLPPQRQRSNVGIALTSDQHQPSRTRANHVQSDSMNSMSRYSGLTSISSAPSTATARAELNRQHRRDQTRRAFAAPAGPSRTSAIPAKHVRDSGATASTAALLNSSTRTQSTQATESTDLSSMRTADLTFPGTIPPNRKLTALEQAIGRSRAASIGSSDASHSHSHSHSQHSAGRAAKNATSHSSGSHGSPRSKATITPTRPPRPPSPVATIPAPLSPTFALAPALPHPISPRSSSLRALDTASPTFGVPASLSHATLRPPLQHLDTQASSATGKTVYTDASEGWSRDGTYTPPVEIALAVQGPDSGPTLHVSRADSVSTDTEDDFRGLFFRTPKDATYDGSPLAHSPVHAQLHSQSSPAAFPRSEINHVGLGYGLDVKASSASAPTPSLPPRPISFAKSADHSISTESSHVSRMGARRLSYGDVEYEGTDSDSGIVITPHGPEVDEGEHASMAQQLRGE